MNSTLLQAVAFIAAVDLIVWAALKWPKHWTRRATWPHWVQGLSRKDYARWLNGEPTDLQLLKWFASIHGWSDPEHLSDDFDLTWVDDRPVFVRRGGRVG